MNKNLSEPLRQITRDSAMQPDAIPQIELYMDQVTTLLERELTATKRNEDDKIMTKTMINNYSKERLLPPSNKKKYSRHHILLLSLIYEYKQILSISDIHTLLGPMIEDGEALEAFYKEYLLKDAEQKQLLEEALRSETSDDLRLIAQTLVTRAALEKRLAEKLLDRIQADEAPPVKEEKPVKEKKPAKEPAAEES